MFSQHVLFFKSAVHVKVGTVSEDSTVDLETVDQQYCSRNAAIYIIRDSIVRQTNKVLILTYTTMNDKHIFYYNRKITLQSFTLGDPEWFKVLGPIFYILAELSILLFPANNINYRFVIVLYIADMEMQNYSIHGKKLRNTASHSTNINIAKMVGHPTFSSFVFFAPPGCACP